MQPKFTKEMWRTESQQSLEIVKSAIKEVKELPVLKIVASHAALGLSAIKK